MTTVEILIIKLSAIGDVTHTLPALEALHHRFPESNITWLVEEKAQDIIQEHPYLKRVLVSKRKSWLNNFKSPSLWYTTVKDIKSFMRELRSQNYDMVIDFQGLLKSGMLVFLSRGKKKIGYDNAREMSSIFLNKKIPQYPMDCHAVDRNINLVKHLGVKPEKVTFTMFIGEEDKRRAEHHLSDNKINKNKRLVAINSQAGWATKIWSPLKLAKLSDMIIKDFDAQIIFTGGKDDNPSVENILFSMDHRAVNLAGKTTLKELAHILSISDLMITMDSGPMHIASAMGTPTVPLFGPTAPWRTGPYCNNSIIIRNQIPCSPCFKRKCDTMDCMNKISIDDVLGAVQKQFGRMRKQ